MWLLALETAIYLEGTRLRERLLNIATTGWWIGDPDPDATFFVPLLLLAPFCFLFPVSWANVVGCFPTSWQYAGEKWITQSSASFRPWVMVAAVVTVSLSMSWATARYEVPAVPGKTLGELGPYVHDEFSYRLQAETMLAGRWWWPGVLRARELFHQMHVLNEEKFASRYFPGTGMWLAPFVALGVPVVASWLAGMITASLAALITRRTHGPVAGWLAGILVAVAPGPCLINNLLLAHGPTLLGLMFCLYCFRHLLDAVSIRYALGAGMGLALAMLSRPLTAGSIALPFGVWWFTNGLAMPWWQRTTPSTTWACGTLAMGTPLVIGFGLLGWQNGAITGQITQTPYSQYNALYTPRHVFGFHQSTSIETPPLNRYLRDYDQWAQPITWSLAIENLATRLKDCWRWSLGLIPLGMGSAYFFLTWKQQTVFDRLIFVSIITLHAAHMPYWLSGILGYHYVFESGVLWLMLFAGVVTHLGRAAMDSDRILAVVWIAGMLLLSVAINFCPLASGSTVPRVTAGIRRVTHAAERYERFRSTLASAPLSLPALVLVSTTAADLHVEYVRNRPPFDATLLIGRYRPELYSDAEVLRLFPERAVYVYDCDLGSLHQLDARLKDRSFIPSTQP